MASRIRHKISIAVAPWLTEQGLDFARFPIDSVLQQALSPDEKQFRTGCSLLKSMSYGGRVEAGVFLLGLLRQYPEDYARLTLIAEALASFPAVATVDALASELRRVKGSSSTRGYLRRILETLEEFPAQLVEEKIEELSSDPQVGTRFRQRLRSMMPRCTDE
ncbi:MAG: hypothetical protein ACREBY_17780 [Polaromonas sp.]